MVSRAGSFDSRSAGEKCFVFSIASIYGLFSKLYSGNEEGRDMRSYQSLIAEVIKVSKLLVIRTTYYIDRLYSADNRWSRECIPLARCIYDHGGPGGGAYLLGMYCEHIL